MLNAEGGGLHAALLAYMTGARFESFDVTDRQAAMIKRNTKKLEKFIEKEGIGYVIPIRRATKDTPARPLDVR